LLENPATQGFGYELNSGATLLLVTPETDRKTTDRIAQTTDAILTWLGAPPGLRIHLWYRDDPRQINADQWPTKSEVNGGWATPGKPTIVIYRKEEWERVLIHETIHALKWDWTIGPTPKACWKLNTTDTIAPHLFEAWTELYAEWLVSAWYRTTWSEQREWQDFQAVQLLARAKEAWHENTNVFAYYVLKAALAPHMEFLWVVGQGQTPEEQSYILCGLVTPELDRLRALAKQTTPQQMSLCMSKPDRKN